MMAGSLPLIWITGACGEVVESGVSVASDGDGDGEAGAPRFYWRRRGLKLRRGYATPVEAKPMSVARCRTDTFVVIDCAKPATVDSASLSLYRAPGWRDDRRDEVDVIGGEGAVRGECGGGVLRRGSGRRSTCCAISQLRDTALLGIDPVEGYRIEIVYLRKRGRAVESLMLV